MSMVSNEEEKKSVPWQKSEAERSKGEHAFCYLLHLTVPCYHEKAGRCIDWGPAVDAVWRRWASAQVPAEAFFHLVGPALSYAKASKMKENLATLNRGEELAEVLFRKETLQRRLLLFQYPNLPQEVRKRLADGDRNELKKLRAGARDRARWRSKAGSKVRAARSLAGRLCKQLRGILKSPTLRVACPRPDDALRLVQEIVAILGGLSQAEILTQFRGSSLLEMVTAMRAYKKRRFWPLLADLVWLASGTPKKKLTAESLRKEHLYHQRHRGPTRRRSKRKSKKSLRD